MIPDFCKVRVYYEVCEEFGVEPKPVWVTEFARTFTDDEKLYTLGGAEAYPKHVMEVFSSYSVERAYWYCVSCIGDGHYNLFDWENNILTPTQKWDFYVNAASNHENFVIGEDVGFGKIDGVELFGICPYEDFASNAGEANGQLPEVQSTFTYESDDGQNFLQSVTHSTVDSTFVLPISFDVNDLWVREYGSASIWLEIDYKCPDGKLELRYQNCCNEIFEKLSVSTDFYDNLFCPAFLDGLTVVDSIPDYSRGIGRNDPTAINSLTLYPSDPDSVVTATFWLEDFLFNNGMEKRADISVVPVENQPFEIHSVRILFPDDHGNVVYADKSTETQLAYTGQPRNAMAWDFSGDGLKDLLITKYAGDAIANLSVGIGPGGVPQMEDVSLDAFPISAPLAGTNGIITADFDNDGLVDFFAPNHLTGGRLFRNVDGDHFEDITSASGLSNSSWANVLAHTYTGSWADYDGDGFPDLTIVASEGGFSNDFNTLLVLHNNNGIFDSAVITPSNSVGMSPLWADFDNDGDLDLVILGSAPTAVGEDPPAHLNVAYLNQGNGTFVEHFLSPDIINNYFGNRIAAVSDYDNDGDFDVIFADEQSVSVVENGTPQNFPNYFWANISFGDNNLPAGISGIPVDLSVLDYDLDGFQDVLVTYGEIISTSVPSDIVLFANREGLNSNRVLVDETNAVGVADNSKSGGMAVSDFNGDGFSDLYFSKSSSNPFFFKAKPALGYAQNYWIGLRLISNNGLTSSNGLGTKATVKYGSALQTQVVDGGSGLASQHQADLVFGLGEFAGEVAVNIVWPNGHSQTATFSELNQYHTVLSDIPRVDNATVQFSRTFQVNSEVEEWVFSWETFGEGVASLDQVIFDLQSVPTRCWPEHSVLSDALNSVTTVVSELGDGKFLHTLTYTGVECTPRCAIPYTVESAQPSFPNTSDLNSASIKFCVQSQ